MNWKICHICMCVCVCVCVEAVSLKEEEGREFGRKLDEFGLHKCI